jgi:hypothetical protein
MKPVRVWPIASPLPRAAQVGLALASPEPARGFSGRILVHEQFSGYFIFDHMIASAVTQELRRKAI